MFNTTDFIDSQKVPPSKEEREEIRQKIESLSFEEIFTKNSLEQTALSLVKEEYTAWTMVLLGSRLWRKRVEHIPLNRRFVLLPHCLRAEHCPAKYDAEGLHCVVCGHCELGSLKSEAESLGYHVLIAEGSPAVMQLILRSSADAILGVGCLRSLERAFDKLQFAGIPALAVPLHASHCKNSQTDWDWVREMIQTPFIATENSSLKDSSYLSLLRLVSRIFDDLPPSENITQQTANEFLQRGGKFYRPFIALATYHVFSPLSLPTTLSPLLKAVAQSVEIFHKASLIHDDIEDGDSFRYGKPTLHQQHGIAVAINVGDYLIGWGYRAIAALCQTVSAKIIAEMLGKLSHAHTKLCEGQGNELAWREKPLTPTAKDVLKIYVLKTAPAFEAALSLGVLSAIADGNTDWAFYRQSEEAIARFSRQIGVAFQIKNDIDDWFPSENKQVAGNDALNNRPTILQAFAQPAAHQKESVQTMFERFQTDGVFDKAKQLIEKSAAKAREIADEIGNTAFRDLLYHFVETIAE